MNTLKEKYWKTGNIFEFNTGCKRLVWNEAVIDNRGYIPKSFFNDELVNKDNIAGEYVIRIYYPNNQAQYFAELIEPKPEHLLWEKSKYIYTKSEIKEKLGIPEEENLIILNENKTYKRTNTTSV